jgi:predicted PilT family ATPase
LFQQDNIVESEMRVDPKYHRHFVARRGEVLHQIADQYGGVMISFPRAGVPSDKVVLKGSKDCVEGAKLRIEEIVHDLESMITIECVIPQKLHRTVMGAKGFKVQGITQEFDVQIKFPERENSNNGEEEEHVNGDGANRPCDIIRITGKKENCEEAKQALLDLMPVTIEVNVAYEYHRSIIGQKGRDVREMMEKYDVHIVLSPADQKLDIIKISGTPACVAKAKEAVEERCKQLEEDRADRQLRSYELKVTFALVFI